jgi:putative transposase
MNLTTPAWLNGQDLHLIWQMAGNHEPDAEQSDFLMYTAQQIKFHLQNNNPELLERCKVQTKDRKFQIWKRNALSIDFYAEEAIFQKLHYTHLNPVRAGFAALPEPYFYASASFYNMQNERFTFLSHYRG